MSDEYQRTDRDREAGSIGIGAMIVFIALILVAAVASTIIIKTAEELQQNAENTSDDTRKEISGKISVIQVLVNGTDGTDIDNLTVTAKVAAGSTDVQVQNIDWLITCGGSSFGLITGNLGLNDTAGGYLNVADPNTEFVNADYLSGADYSATDELPSGTIFKFDIELDDGTASGAQDIGARDGLGACAASAGVGESLEMKIIVDGGGTTILELNIESVTSGKEVT
jgi:flagellin FlaB